MDFGFGFLVFVNFMGDYFNNVGLILVFVGFGSVVGPCLFVVDLSGVEVSLEVWPGLVGGRFFIPFFDYAGEDACFCGDYFFNDD